MMRCAVAILTTVLGAAQIDCSSRDCTVAYLPSELVGVFHVPLTPGDFATNGALTVCRGQTCDTSPVRWGQQGTCVGSNNPILCTTELNGDGVALTLTYNVDLENMPAREGETFTISAGTISGAAAIPAPVRVAHYTMTDEPNGVGCGTRRRGTLDPP